jgi:hypothetical protein
MSEKISAGILQATGEVLSLVSPDLCHHVSAIGRRGPLPYVPRRGQSSYHDYELSMRADDASAILSALQHAEQQYGRERLFFGFQLSALVMFWMGFVERLRAQPE